MTNLLLALQSHGTSPLPTSGVWIISWVKNCPQAVKRYEAFGFAFAAPPTRLIVVEIVRWKDIRLRHSDWLTNQNRSIKTDLWWKFASSSTTSRLMLIVTILSSNQSLVWRHCSREIIWMITRTIVSWERWITFTLNNFYTRVSQTDELGRSTRTNSNQLGRPTWTNLDVSAKVFGNEILPERGIGW